MTYSEKVKYLFPALNESNQAARSPPGPAVVGSFMNDSPTLTATEARTMRDRDSKRTMSSVRTRSMFGTHDQDTQRQVSMGRLINEAGDLQQQSPAESSWGMQGNKRASSPILPMFGDLRSATTADFEDDMTNLGSVYSPQQVQQVGLAVHQARAIEVTRGEPASLNNRAVSALPGGEEMIIMLDTSVAREMQQDKAQDGSGSPVDDGSPVEDATSTRSSGPWHLRLGEKTLSFSGRSDRRHSKRGPPPTPLALSNRPTQAKQVAIAKAAEPSPLPSPEEALQMIQAQLQKYEHADRVATESPGRQALLNDLEAEMGQQESRWLGMQNRYTQDSLTTLSTPTAESRRVSAVVADSSSEHNLSRSSSNRSLSMYRRTRQQSIAASIMSLTNDEDVPFGSRASLWQRRLAAAHQEFMHTAGELDKRSTNFLASNLGSPSPPDSDESESETESRRNLAAVLARRAREDEIRIAATTNSLWNAPLPEEERSGLMWVRPERPYYIPTPGPVLPGLSIRPAQRKTESGMSIDSDELWQNSGAIVCPPSSKLWSHPGMVEEAKEIPIPEPEIRSFYNPEIRRSQTVSGRPLTQRPPRRSRRITSLPDIVEDPVPLPDKRGTLGIFAFPWGEKSDVASVGPVPGFRNMPGTMSTGGVRSTLDLRSRELEQQEYSSSFFDEYEQDDDDDDYSESMGSESDDGFDETTLFEIANLLKTNNVPSTESFFGASRDSGDSLVDQYMTDEQRDERDRVATEEEMEGLQLMPSPMPPRKPLSLWEDIPTDEKRGAHGKGLPQSEDWDRYDKATETTRAKPRASQQPASVDSDHLWAPEPPTNASSDKSPMWTPPDSPAKTVTFDSASPSVETSIRSLPLWQAQEQRQQGEHGVGLPQPQDWPLRVGSPSTARTKPRQSEASVIESTDLWTFAEPVLTTSANKMWASKAQSAPVSRAASPQEHAVHQVNETSKMLWSAPSSPKELLVGGLFSTRSGRTVFRTTVQNPAAIPMVRKAQPSSRGLEPLTSATLWASATPTTVERNWISARVARKTGHSSTQLLWSAPTSPVEAADPGLFTKSARTVFRTTSEAPAAFGTVRKVRVSQFASVDRLESSALWAFARQTTPETHWLSKKTNSPGSSLWSAPMAPVETAGPGLFTMSARTVFRTTSEAPAALETVRKVRSVESAPLDHLDSHALWISTVQDEPEKYWLLMKTDGPKKSLWSAPASPQEAADPGLYAKSSRTVFKTTSQVPAAIEMTRKPRSLKEQDLGQVASTSLWTRDNDSRSERHWISSASTSRIVTPAVATPVRELNLEQWQHALANAVAASYPVVSASSVTSKESTATSDQWRQALHEAIAASYPVHLAARRKAPVEATPADWAAALTEAVSASYTVPFDVSRRHPVFAASSLATNASIIHPAATGYTSDVASVHPVFFGSGIGKAVHPAMPAKVAAASENTEQASAHQTSSAPAARGRRITAMASMFENGNQEAPLGRSFSISRKSSVRRSATPPRPATPELQIEEPQPVVPDDEPDADPALLAQIEALEQERLFAEQWAAGSFAPIENVSEPTGGLLEPSPLIISNDEGLSTANKAEQLAQELVTPTSESESPVLFMLEAKTYQAPKKQQPLSAEELGEQMFTPKDVSPETPLAVLSVSPSEPKSEPSSEPKTPASLQPATPKSNGWLSALSSRFAAKSPKTPPSASASTSEKQPQAPQFPQIAEPQRSDPVKSSVSTPAGSGTITLMDSLSVASHRTEEAKARGSKIEFRFG